MTKTECREVVSSTAAVVHFPRIDETKMGQKYFVAFCVFFSLLNGVISTSADSRIQTFLPTENSNLEVLKELGVDFQQEGKTTVIQTSLTQGGSPVLVVMGVSHITKVVGSNPSNIYWMDIISHLFVVRIVMFG